LTKGFPPEKKVIQKSQLSTKQKTRTLRFPGYKSGRGQKGEGDEEGVRARSTAATQEQNKESKN